MRASFPAVGGCCAVHLGALGLAAGAASAPIVGVAASGLIAGGVIAMTAPSRRREAATGAPGWEAQP